MKVDLSAGPGRLCYRLTLDGDDRRTFMRVYSDARAAMELVNTSYQVRLPPAFSTIHPDLHAVAIWHVVWPLVSTSLKLPFAVSQTLARHMAAAHNVAFTPVDAGLAPRRMPQHPRPCLLFSGGMDSAAASMVLPADTVHLFLDRIGHLPRGPCDPDSLIELIHQRALCELLRRQGREVAPVSDDHEFLFSPYPCWHSDPTPMAALYLADAYSLGIMDTGDVLDVHGFRGYLGQEVHGWRFRRPGEVRSGHDQDRDLGVCRQAHQLVGLQRASSIAGLSEVATAIIVSKGPYRGRTASCYYRSPQPFCMRCDKCFKKLILLSIIDGQEVSADLFEHFLSIPHLAQIFSRPYFDWHHVWYYIFQKMRCGHWFAEKLQRQAAQGPDLSLLERWYPGARPMMAWPYRDVVEANIRGFVPAMTDREVEQLHCLDLPPLLAPELPHARPLSLRPADRPKAEQGPAAEEGPSGDKPPAVRSEAEALKDLLVELLGPRPGEVRSFGGYFVGEIAVRPGRPWVDIELVRQGSQPDSGAVAERIRLMVQRVASAGAKEDYYCRAGDLGIRYYKTTPIRSASGRRGVLALASFLSRARTRR